MESKLKQHRTQSKNSNGHYYYRFCDCTIFGYFIPLKSTRNVEVCLLESVKSQEGDGDLTQRINSSTKVNWETSPKNLTIL